MTDWIWRDHDGDGRLLYEPGNWGDLLKAQWAVTVIWWLREQFPGRRLVLLDTFAGAPEYPLSTASRRRLGQLADAEFDKLCRTWIDRGRWPSTATLGLAAGEGAGRVFDLDPGSRGEWAKVAGVELMTLDSGWNIEEQMLPDSAGLVLIDPYDLLAQWREYLASLVEMARKTTVLIYVYNRAVKSPERMRDYRNFRNALAGLRQDLPVIVGRTPADSFLPTAHHEMVLLPAQELVAHPAAEQLYDRLEEKARRLLRIITEGQACER